MTWVPIIALATFFLGLLIYRSTNEIIALLKENNAVYFSKGQKFGIWSDIESSWLNDFSLGYVNNWEYGHNFVITCTVNSSEPEGIKRACISVNSVSTALSQDQVIGRGKKKEDYVDIGVALKPCVAKSFLEEVTKFPKGKLHLHGKIIENEAIYVTYLSFSPNVDI